ncbi:MAG: nuclear transport factor 2 family protein [Amycolatopsis sp.]|jgi:hypothetical protein|uniref:nuclear transport factor 2 family protein n=1 Tax=Amycolatopsis sp. TaxID=37632 RepID=UPI00262647B6|nr:nuclear transport factor 2 family protein [Amycolatopsis sp.]MCU1682970.1 nuclear transport factor 2 family protein [Amycolatopsis sp.]
MSTQYRVTSPEREIDEVMARYVRAHDYRDAAAMSALFADDGVVEIFYCGNRENEHLGTLEGAATIGNAIAGMMKPHPPRGWSHNVTSSHIVHVDGDTATLEVQFIIFNAVGDEQPADGWPAGAFGSQGSITPIESGYYETTLHRSGDQWKITKHVIKHDIPYALA